MSVTSIKCGAGVRLSEVPGPGPYRTKADSVNLVLPVRQANRGISHPPLLTEPSSLGSRRSLQRRAGLKGLVSIGWANSWVSDEHGVESSGKPHAGRPCISWGYSTASSFPGARTYTQRAFARSATWNHVLRGHGSSDQEAQRTGVGRANRGSCHPLLDRNDLKAFLYRQLHDHYGVVARLDFALARRQIASSLVGLLASDETHHQAVAIELLVAFAKFDPNASEAWRSRIRRSEGAASEGHARGRRNVAPLRSPCVEAGPARTCDRVRKGS